MRHDMAGLPAAPEDDRAHRNGADMLTQKIAVRPTLAIPTAPLSMSERTGASVTPRTGNGCVRAGCRCASRQFRRPRSTSTRSNRRQVLPCAPVRPAETPKRRHAAGRCRAKYSVQAWGQASTDGAQAASSDVLVEEQMCPPPQGHGEHRSQPRRRVPFECPLCPATGTGRRPRRQCPVRCRKCASVTFMSPSNSTALAPISSLLPMIGTRWPPLRSRSANRGPRPDPRHCRTACFGWTAL